MFEHLAVVILHVISQHPGKGFKAPKGVIVPCLKITALEIDQVQRMLKSNKEMGVGNDISTLLIF